MNYDFGDIVLTTVQFSDNSGNKKRPAVVVSSRYYNDVSNEVVVLAITSNIARKHRTDLVIDDWVKAGLLKPSVIRAQFVTASDKIVYKKLGALREIDLDSLEAYLPDLIGEN